MSYPQGQPQGPPGYAPQQGGYPPTQGGYPPPQGGYPVGTANPNQVTVVTTQPQTVVVGGCAQCGIGHISENYTGLGICLAICFFPLGVLCCLMLTEKRCSHCGAQY